eukprot:GHRQ01031469.1.p1 GENE.GHRQ01031469.1~~GHRQ01031469.1.p1  ORF type:complete len:192 (+),score=37.16 GHRQ01031469.1:270-845(+)
MLQVSTVLGAALEEQRKEGEWIEGIAIWVAVAIVIMVGAGNDYQKDLQFRKLNAQKDVIEVTVTRAGQTVMVKNTDLVVGDVYLVNMGDKVVADGIMIDGFHLVIDEASLTGESDPIKKIPEEDPWVRSGTQVSEGSGRLLVVATGTQVGSARVGWNWSWLSSSVSTAVVACQQRLAGRTIARVRQVGGMH